MSISKTFAVICLLLVAGVSCWWDGGHMLVAEIAKQQIVARNQTLFDVIEKYVKIISPLCDDRSQDFVTAASWMDDIKDDAMSFWYNWHYYDRPVNPDGLYIQQSQDDATSNSIAAVKRAIQELSMNYTYPIENASGISIQQAFFMRILIHVIGDMHQPLHNVNMYNNTYPIDGDLGANLERVLLLNGTDMVLHAYFDSGALRLDGFNRPLSIKDAETLTNYAQAFQVKYPRTVYGNKLKTNDTQVWSQEAYDIAVNFIYPFVYKTNQLTPAFDNQAYKIIMEQITLAGYRLADTLMTIFDPTYKIYSSST